MLSPILTTFHRYSWISTLLLGAFCWVLFASTIGTGCFSRHKAKRKEIRRTKLDKVSGGGLSTNTGGTTSPLAVLGKNVVMPGTSLTPVDKTPNQRRSDSDGAFKPPKNTGPESKDQKQILDNQKVLADLANKPRATSKNMSAKDKKILPYKDKKAPPKQSTPRNGTPVMADKYSTTPKKAGDHRVTVDRQTKTAEEKLSQKQKAGCVSKQKNDGGATDEETDEDETLKNIESLQVDHRQPPTVDE